jgi:hypothetical protein
MNDRWVYDIETYPNCFTFCAIPTDSNEGVVFEISDRKDHEKQLRKFCADLYKRKSSLIGFNNVFFDYPVLHYILTRKNLTAREIYNYAMSVIHASEEDKFKFIINDKQRFIPQIDLFKIWHFDNMARATSLKILEFNMKSDNIEDLPFPLGKMLTHDEIDVLIKYNGHDVIETRKFYERSIDKIDFRVELSDKYQKNFMNHNDTKIGKDYFIMELEKNNPGCCYMKGKGGKKVRQTRRKYIDLKEVVLPYVNFERDEFKEVLGWLQRQRITETKGVFNDITEYSLGGLAKFAHMKLKRKKLKSKPTDSDVAKLKANNPSCFIEEKQLKSSKKMSYYHCWYEAEKLNCVIDGFCYDFGTGGIHGSVESQVVCSDDEYVIIDLDVASYYPNLAIANRLYPSHLGEDFCDIYKDVYDQRVAYKKAGQESIQLMMKLALNGVYGDSNSQFSPFYDPKYTMTITIGGQLSLCMLAEQLLKIDDLSMVQLNTDGLTVKVPRKNKHLIDGYVKSWEDLTGLAMEEAVYSRMMIRDVNNYIAEYEGTGKLKRKGAYEYKVDYHQNHSSLVIAKAAEAAIVHGKDVGKFIRSHKDKYDFLLRTKVPRSSRLVLMDDDGTEVAQQNICRYYVSDEGGSLIKIMPPLANADKVQVTLQHPETAEEMDCISKADFDKAERKGFTDRIKETILPAQERRIGIDTKWKVKTCNNILDFSWDINYDYYIEEAKKLVDPLINENEKGEDDES